MPNEPQIAIRKASAALAVYFKTSYPDFGFAPEAEAAITHWLQAMSSLPPLMPPELVPSANTLLAAIAHADHMSGQVGSPSENEISETDPSQLIFDIVYDDIPFPPPKRSSFSFIDLFAGIGGIRMAFQKAGGKCLFSSEWDKYAKKTYERNFGEVPYGDIRKIDEVSIPDHDVLCAGFPCQPFSLAGVSKKNSLGRKHGFDDPTQGTLFFDIKRIIKEKKPKAFFLENVKNLLHHDKGKTWEIIRQSLEKDLGYLINWRVVDAANWVPQHRERIFIVGYDPGQISIDKNEIVIPTAPSNGHVYPELASIVMKKVDQKYTLGVGTWATLERHKAYHSAAGNGFGYGMHKLPIREGAVTRTISARYHKDGAEILIDQPDRECPRRLTIEEAMQLQGFDPKCFIFPVSATQAYKQIGNSVAVPAVASCAAVIADTLKKRGRM